MTSFLSIIFMLLLLRLGKLLKLPKENTFVMLKALLMIIIETFVSSLTFILIIISIIYSGILELESLTITSLFILVFIMMFINGVVLYYIKKIFSESIQNVVLTLCEYFIQWSLIYITIYQVIFDTFIPKTNVLDSIKEFNFANPTVLMILVLPSFISIWISIILYKLKENNL